MIKRSTQHNEGKSEASLQFPIVFGSFEPALLYLSETYFSGPSPLTLLFPLSHSYLSSFLVSFHCFHRAYKHQNGDRNEGWITVAIAIVCLWKSHFIFLDLFIPTVSWLISQEGLYLSPNTNILYPVLLYFILFYSSPLFFTLSLCIGFWRFNFK